jgi:hypothetical protein
MVAARLLSRDELKRRLQTYRCELIEAYPSGFELWETGWGEPFTLWPEDGRYDEWQYFKLVGGLIAQTMPQDWNGE